MKKLFAGLKTLRVRIIAIVALCWLLPVLVLGVYMSSIFFDALRVKTEQALVASATHAQDLVIKEIERVLKKSKDITYDETIYTYLTRYREGVIDYETFYIACRTYWHKLFQREQVMPFTAFFPVDEPGKMIHTADDVNRVREFSSDVLPYILRLGNTLDTRSRFAYVGENVYLVRNLYNRRMERFGMVVLGMNADMLLAPLLDESLIWNGEVDILLDEYHHQANPEYPFAYEDYQPGLLSLDGDLYYSQRVKTSDYTLTYRIRLDRSVILGQVNEYYQLIFILILLLVPLEAVIILFVHRSLTKPIMQLSEATQRLAGGELGITVPTQGMDEIGRLGMAFNAMSLRIRRLIDKSYREELALRDARISALQSRINPHFMNNALELMNWQARMEGADAVSQMIEAMSTLINAALDRTDERTVPLYTEVEVADAYFFFIKQRFGDRVSIEKMLDESLREVRVPRLIIQTLLENAVEHGINPAGGGIIRLHAYTEESMLYIDVRNNGKRISDEEQEKVNQLLSDTSREAQSEHLGIRNVNLRLKLIYHEEAGLNLLTDENGETLARIYIPLAEKEG